MQHKVFTIKDSAVGTYHPPFFNNSHGEAERNFRDLVNDNKSTVSQHPEDFDLFYIGIYDSNQGKFIELEPTPKHMIKAQDLKKQPLKVAQTEV